jgi:hypothetical protein
VVGGAKYGAPPLESLNGFLRDLVSRPAAGAGSEIERLKLARENPPHHLVNADPVSAGKPGWRGIDRLLGIH